MSQFENNTIILRLVTGFFFGGIIVVFKLKLKKNNNLC